MVSQKEVREKVLVDSQRFMIEEFGAGYSDMIKKAFESLREEYTEAEKEKVVRVSYNHGKKHKELVSKYGGRSNGKDSK